MEKLSEILQVRLPAKLYKFLSSDARDEHIPISMHVRNLLRKYMEQREEVSGRK
jgi:hypothetical protein